MTPEEFKRKLRSTEPQIVFRVIFDYGWDERCLGDLFASREGAEREVVRIKKDRQLDNPRIREEELWP